MTSMTDSKKSSKIYCEKCDNVFESKEKFFKHFDTIHSSGISCESCPIDTVISKLVGIFKRNSNI